MSQHSKACCTIPPVVGTDYYHLKGKYEDLNGTRTYVTGPDSAEIAILSIYDIFGFYPQTLQGADILAHGGDTGRQYKVFVPGFFAGNPADIAWYPPDTDEKTKLLTEWFTTTALPEKHLPRVPGLLHAAENSNSNIKSWGVMGYCWGAKMSSLLAGNNSMFKAAVQTSPASEDTADARQVQIPMMVLASKDESPDDIKAYDEALNVTKHVEIFEDQIHGWMSARGDLENDDVKKEYERGYRLALSFFKDNID